MPVGACNSRSGACAISAVLLAIFTMVGGREGKDRRRAPRASGAGNPAVAPQTLAPVSKMSTDSMRVLLGGGSGPPCLWATVTNGFEYVAGVLLPLWLLLLP